MDVLLTYDIADTSKSGAARLRRLSAICERYGQRIQLSVFQFRFSPTRLERLVGEVENVIDHQRDSVILYRFPESIEKFAKHLGRPQQRGLGEPWMV